MARKKTHNNKPSQPATTPRQVALVLPHASATAGPSFETALETLSSELTVHKLWQAKPAPNRAKK